MPISPSERAITRNTRGKFGDIVSLGAQTCLARPPSAASPLSQRSPSSEPAQECRRRGRHASPPRRSPELHPSRACRRIGRRRAVAAQVPAGRPAPVPRRRDGRRRDMTASPRGSPTARALSKYFANVWWLMPVSHDTREEPGRYHAERVSRIRLGPIEASQRKPYQDRLSLPVSEPIAPP